MFICKNRVGREQVFQRHIAWKLKSIRGIVASLLVLFHPAKFYQDPFVGSDLTVGSTTWSHLHTRTVESYSYAVKGSHRVIVNFNIVVYSFILFVRLLHLLNPFIACSVLVVALLCTLFSVNDIVVFYSI